MIRLFIDCSFFGRFFLHLFLKLLLIFDSLSLSASQKKGAAALAVRLLQYPPVVQSADNARNGRHASDARTHWQRDFQQGQSFRNAKHTSILNLKNTETLELTS